MPKQFLFAGAALVIILGIGGGVYFTREKAAPPPAADAPLGYVLDDVPLSTLTALMPDLSRETRFSDSTTPEVRALFQTKISASIVRLTEDPTRGSDWLDLGLFYHSVGDYDGARGVWEFLTNVSPKDTVAFDNLGKLYHFSLKDFPKAESYFKQSIALNPYLINPYLDLFDLYRYSYKTETTAAVDILKDASAIFPDNADILTLLGGYYRDHADSARARTAFLRALDLARDAGDLARIKSINEALMALPN